jgi:multidrug resistance efflux pump
MRPKRVVSRAIYLAILGLLLVLGLRGGFLYAFVPETLGIVDGGSTRISSESAGRILDIKVAPGMKVEAGQLLMHLELANHGRETALAQAKVQRLSAQVKSEQKRAAARARDLASRESAKAADLRDKALASSASVASIAAQITSARNQLLEVDKDLTKFESMGKKKVIAETSYLDLRLRKLEIAGRIKSLEGKAHWLEQKAESGMIESDRLLERATHAEEEAIAGSNVAFIEAQLAEARAELDMLEGLGRHEIRAPGAGTVSWVLARKGEFVQPGELLLDFVPSEEAHVIAYPEDEIESFPVQSRVRLQGPGFEAEGIVETWFVQDRQKPGSLLRPYQRDALSPAIAIRVEKVLSGVLRSGAAVRVSRPVF